METELTTEQATKKAAYQKAKTAWKAHLAECSVCDARGTFSCDTGDVLHEAMDHVALEVEWSVWS